MSVAMTVNPVSDVDQRFGNAVRHYVAVAGYREGTGAWQGWMSPPSGGVVVMLRDGDGDPWCVWAGPLAPDRRIAEHHVHDRGRSGVVLPPLAVFVRCAKAWRAYRAYINDRAAAGLRLPAMIRLRPLNRDWGIQLPGDARTSLDPFPQRRTM